MTEKDLEDVLEIRDALDGLAVECACLRMTEKDFVNLEHAMEVFQKAVDKGEVRSIVEADEAFHNVIYEATGNPKLITIISNLKEQMYRYRYEYIKCDSDYSKIVEEHSKIMDGLRRSDIGYVKEIMHTHLDNQIDAVRGLIRRQNEEVSYGNDEDDA